MEVELAVGLVWWMWNACDGPVDIEAKRIVDIDDFTGCNVGREFRVGAEPIFPRS